MGVCENKGEKLNYRFPIKCITGLVMNRYFTFLIVVAFLMVLTASSFFHLLPFLRSNEAQPFYVGVSFCGDTIHEAKLLIDRVKDYTNLFVLQSGPISKNETALNEICDYAVESELDIIVYFGWFDPEHPWQLPWLDYAKQRWGDRFLGVYYYDEPGGIQIDNDWRHLFTRIQQRNSTIYQSIRPVIEAYLNGTLPRDYNEAAKRFIEVIQNDPGIKELKERSITTFTSDYAIYWFDYLGGYDVLLAQLGWNHSIVQSIDLVRGAARMQNKSWGTIITWKYEKSPYLASGDEIYQQMRMSYEAGAEYVVIFNYPKIKDNPYGVMFDEHFDALYRFWNGVVQNPKVIHGSIQAEAALILPRNYGWGMRHPDDKIWYWGSDEKSLQIWKIYQKLIEKYGLRLDIIYDDPAFPVAERYPQMYYWNHTY
ncbi:MAG: hypothetical protein ACOC6H_02755 [Thermoproteota archaeon]